MSEEKQIIDLLVAYKISKDSSITNLLDKIESAEEYEDIINVAKALIKEANDADKISTIIKELDDIINERK